ncbi:MAG: domain/GAF domain/HD domain protein, partial [Planctomycetaceae bacterium]|nr:domain/GAF domain/HD domain protein [Planctomycetaceae bacterium]
MVEQAQTITILLETGFGTRVSLFDPQSGYELPLHSRDRQACPRIEITPDAIRAHATLKKTLIQPLNENTYQVVLPVMESGQTKLIGVTEMLRFARNESATQQEISRLESWCDLMLDKISVSSERNKLQVEARQRENQACAVLSAFDVLLRNTRIYGESGRFQRHALKAISEVLNAEMAVCVIGDASTVHSSLSGTGLTSWECRQLAAHLSARNDWDRAGILIDNDTQDSPLAKSFPKLNRLVAVKIPADGRSAYVVAINKKSRNARSTEENGVKTRSENLEMSLGDLFQRSDAALLASFSTLVGAQSKTSQRHQELKDLVVGLTRALTAAIDAKDSYTAGHSERVARMSVELGKELGLPEEQLNDIYLAGLLHDIGKIGIRDEVLGKNGRLTDEERKHINEHVVIGHRILSGLTGIDHLLPGVLYHHEQFNGTGYPEGLAGDRIPRLARIIAVADSFDAMSSDRPYRLGMPLEKVDLVLRNGAGKQWDPVII